MSGPSDSKPTFLGEVVVDQVAPSLPGYGAVYERGESGGFRLTGLGMIALGVIGFALLRGALK
ncbi:MAG: hypothetical protein MK098_12945 [Marinovum sp.]|nr:hypothetical protein [Marinovum sp.]